MKTRVMGVLAAGALATTAISTAAAEGIPVGNLADYTGPTSTVSKVHNQGVVDAMDYINAHGGVNGQNIDYDTVEYSYQAPRAIATYKRWKSQMDVVAIQGWGTADTEALVSFVGKDQIPYYSGSYSGHLTDPTGKSPETKKPAPYNFFYGPSYSDGVRAMIQWAAEDWKSRGMDGKPKYVHMGDNHPYPNAAKKAGIEYAKEMGFEIVPAIQYSLSPADFKAQCLTLKESGANYAYLGNTAGSNISLLKACQTVGVDVQFMANVWGFDENAMKAAGDSGDGVVWVVGAQPWTSDAPGMKLVREISKMSDPSGEQYRAVHYTRGICSVYYMKEAMEWADKNGGITGPNIKKGMYQKAEWVPEGLDGVCLSSTWTAEDHRGAPKAFIYQAHYNGGDWNMEELFLAELPRKPEWLGW